jgi:predicted transcriptional regulator of viral defense system
MKSHALVQRLGFIIDFLARERLVRPLPSNSTNLLRGSVGRTPIYLDPRKPKTGSFYKEWRVVCNVSRDQLLSEIEVRRKRMLDKKHVTFYARSSREGSELKKLF